MGTFCSTYPTMRESNQRPPIPQFAWFHPGTYVAATRSNGLNEFQGTKTNPEGFSAVPLRSMAPANEAANDINPETEPANPTTGPLNKGAPMEPKAKKFKKSPSKSKKKKGNGTPSEKRERKNLNSARNEPSLDASGNPAPVCTCTGVARQCYRWGSGGWQSACCTTNVSEYPLPMSTTRPGARLQGRKMSHGAYDKLLQRLTTEGYDLSYPIDLKDHWAKHGTNKFVTIK